MVKKGVILVPIGIFIFITLFVILAAKMLGLHSSIDPESKFTLTVLFLVLLAAGITLAIREGNSIQEALKRQKWPIVKGKVIAAEIVGKRAIEPRLTYVYQPGSKLYTGQSNLQVPGFGTRSVRNDVASKSVETYRKGREVSVYYNPDDPTESRLKPGPNWDEFTRLSFGAILFGIASFGLTSLCHNSRRSSREGSPRKT